MSRPKKPSWEFRAENVVDEIYDAQEMRQQIRNFFHYSPLWRALRELLTGERRDALIDSPYDWVEDREDLRVVCHRGTGYGIRCLDFAIYGFRGESQWVELKVEIEWESQYETFDRKYTIRVPVELCKEFSQEAFDAWIERAGFEKQTEEAKKDLATLQQLQAKYPGSASIGDLIRVVKLRVLESTNINKTGQ